MSRRWPLSLLTALLVVATLQACSEVSPPRDEARQAAPSTQGPAGLRADYERLARAGQSVLAVDPATSEVRIHVFRAGRAAKLGHNHVLSARRFVGFLAWPAAGDLAGARVDLAFRLDQLDIDRPELRARLGPAFASPVSEAAIDDTREHMLGPFNLQADRFPWVLVHSLEVRGEPPKLAVKIQVELHGQRREQWVPLEVAGWPDHPAFSGSFVLLQTDFGVHPYSVLGGLLAVQDPVEIDFRLTTGPL